MGDQIRSRRRAFCHDNLAGLIADLACRDLRRLSARLLGLTIG
jgi:hypothetical protein